MRTNRLVAHRGDNTHYPENSLAGIESALMAGSVNIEFDIQMNLDGSLIVIHDTDFRRTSNDHSSVFATTNIKLKKISVHEPQRFSEIHMPTPVPFLSDVMNLIKRYPKATAFIELKEQSIKQWGLNKVMKALALVLVDHQAQSILISFSYDAIKFAKEKCKIRTGMVLNHYNKATRKIAQQLTPDFLICSYELITEEPLWKGDWQWVIYVINDITEAKSLLKREDIAYIETDDITSFLKT
ncbi:MAG: glycerophosphodiester phosphodiesterase family protein [Cocleimonas sp.]